MLLGVVVAVCLLATACDAGPATDAASSSAVSGGSSSAPARPVDYVNIGDSFSAGAGLGNTVPDSHLFCQRSSSNFAHLVASSRDLQLSDVSCSGADTIDLTNDQYFGVPGQLHALDGVHPKLVTVMIGGNNAGVFADVIKDCGDVASDDPTGAPCTAAYGDKFTDLIQTETFPALRASLREIKSQARGAEVLAIGYPYLVPRNGGCYPMVKMAAGDIPLVRQIERTLNDSVRRAANESGVGFIDMAALSNGRDACASPDVRWVEPQIGSTTAATLHPNERGQQAMADQVLQRFRG